MPPWLPLLHANLLPPLKAGCVSSRGRAHSPGEAQPEGAQPCIYLNCFIPDQSERGRKDKVEKVWILNSMQMRI